MDETKILSARYAKLVRLAYLVLPATGRRRYRLAIAQRIVDASLPRRSDVFDHPYATVRTQVLRRAIRPSRRLRIGLGPRLRRLPKACPATPARLAALDPAVRVAYVLRRVESLPRSMVRDQLAEIGVPDATDVVAAADQVPELSLPRVVPGPSVPRRPRLPIAMAGALTVVTLLAAQTGALGRRAEPGNSPADSAESGHSPADSGPARLASPRDPQAPRVTVVVFWVGRLPGGVRARWICRRTIRVGATGRLTRSDGILVTGPRRRRTDCGRSHGTTVGGTWWRAPTGRWYFVAAAGRRFAVRVVPPPAFPYRVSSNVRAGMALVAGPRGGARPPHGRMTVTAYRM